jgi:hypothetical protein
MLAMPQIESTPVGRLICGDRAGVGLGYTLEATAVRLAEGIAELRETGGIPRHVRTVTTVLPQLAVLEIRIDGLTLDARSDLARLLRVAGAVFDLAGTTWWHSTRASRRCSPNASSSAARTTSSCFSWMVPPSDH